MYWKASYQNQEVFFEAPYSIIYEDDNFRVNITIDSVVSSLEVKEVCLKDLSNLSEES